MSAARIDEGNNDGEDGVDDDRGEDLGNDDDNASFGGDGKIEYDVIDRVTMIPIRFRWLFQLNLKLLMSIVMT